MLCRSVAKPAVVGWDRSEPDLDFTALVNGIIVFRIIPCCYQAEHYDMVRAAIEPSRFSTMLGNVMRLRLELKMGAVFMSI